FLHTCPSDFANIGSGDGSHLVMCLIADPSHWARSFLWNLQGHPQTIPTK
ncbi:hypothetical protein NPIL_23931, partial [Nephila pilipes]